uniref:Uncharacterized protein n=1 Tax=Cacopsylla melanoneura TaxID=428564 RepID=A0A8D8Z555_9HEMI
MPRRREGGMECRKTKRQSEQIRKGMGENREVLIKIVKENKKLYIARLEVGGHCVDNEEDKCKPKGRARSAEHAQNRTRPRNKLIYWSQKVHCGESKWYRQS